jgi:hypothetical protein
MATEATLDWWLFGAASATDLRPAGDSEGLHPEFSRRLHFFCADHGVEVLSGHRSSAEQKFLFDNQHRPGFNPANPPGKSNHEAVPFDHAMALAADLHPESNFDSGNISQAEADEIARKYGIHFPLRLQENEDHHAQPVEVASAQWSGMPELCRWDFSWR